MFYNPNKKDIRFYDKHYKGISILQDYYGKKLSSSNLTTNRKQLTKKKLEFLSIVKELQFYNTEQQDTLNMMREEYHLEKNDPFNLIVRKFR